MRTNLSWLLAVAMLSGTSQALYAADKAEAAVNAPTKDTFVTVSAWVRKQMESGGRYSYVTPDERSKVNAQLDAMGHTFDKTPDVAQMSADEKRGMFNSQEQINAILAKRDNERLICKNESPIGSHIPVKSCQTAGEIEARRRSDAEYLNRNKQCTNQYCK